ncbi:protein FAR-RED IMPAIRED RESPONSE 1-like [Ziziphus jujuba]|uniref:Protein FAR1-RELATED SEQUENCE n=1 Tax=Ziziphus jujuba TaxID=326968 RepID=A0ABM3ZWL5_ZIZJJ|nr:protein FAR-RED IMPAIRED RESPONSE 1-like [Ziziphus jujuba]
MWGQDAELLKEYFLTEQERNSSFMFEIDADDELVFACAVLSDERAESFVWLFKLLKKSMPANTPKIIITDQDPAMIKAVAQSLSNTFHRDFYKDFKHCIWESERPEEFERKWASIIEKANLHDNKWLKSIFELRSRWVPAYVNHVFSAGMSSSQRTESSYAFLKRVLAHQHHEDLSGEACFEIAIGNGEANG